MPYPFSILKNERIPASAQDVETFIRYALGQHRFIIERQDFDSTKRQFILYFIQRERSLDDYLGENEIGKVYWGGIELLEWSDTTEIIRMWPIIPKDWCLGMFGLDRDEVVEKRFERLEELSNEILKHFQHHPSKTHTITHVNYVQHIKGDLVNGDKYMTQNIKVENSSIGGNVIVADIIKDSFNIIQDAPIKDELKKQLQLLTEAVNNIITVMTKEEAEEVADDMKRLAEEATKSSPSKKRYPVSIEGLTKAAENLGEIGKPVIKLAGKVLALLLAG